VLGAALSLKTRFAFSDPFVVGLNVTEIEHVPPCVTCVPLTRGIGGEVPQLPEAAKSAELAPVIDRLPENIKVDEPVFVSSIAAGALVVPWCCMANISGEGDRLTPGPAAVSVPMSVITPMACASVPNW